MGKIRSNEKLLLHFRENADNEQLTIDSNYIKVLSTVLSQRKDKKQSIERNRGGITTKIHTVTKVLGNPLKLCFLRGMSMVIIQRSPSKETNTLKKRL